jgi:hypothetical protein
VAWFKEASLTGAKNMSERNLPKTERDRRANQLNPTHPSYYRSRGASPDEAKFRAEQAKSLLDNRSNQLNPNNAAYEASRSQDANTAPDETTDNIFHEKK